MLLHNVGMNAQIGAQGMECKRSLPGERGLQNSFVIPAQVAIHLIPSRITLPPEMDPAFAGRRTKR